MCCVVIAVLATCLTAGLRIECFIPCHNMLYSVPCLIVPRLMVQLASLCNILESHFEILLHKSPRFIVHLVLLCTSFYCAPYFIVQFFRGPPLHYINRGLLYVLCLVYLAHQNFFCCVYQISIGLTIILVKVAFTTKSKLGTLLRTCNALYVNNVC